VEASPETTSGREAQDRFLFNATVELFEDFDFSRIREVGKHPWIVSRTIAPGVPDGSGGPCGTRLRAKGPSAGPGPADGKACRTTACAGTSRLRGHRRRRCRRTR
jgi:hypothetical protein